MMWTKTGVLMKDKNLDNVIVLATYYSRAHFCAWKNHLKVFSRSGHKSPEMYFLTGLRDALGLKPLFYFIII